MNDVLNDVYNGNEICIEASIIEYASRQVLNWVLNIHEYDSREISVFFSQVHVKYFSNKLQVYYLV